LKRLFVYVCRLPVYTSVRGGTERFAETKTATWSKSRSAGFRQCSWSWP
jgi:hypothetical protein